MANYVIKIPLLNMTLAQATNLTSAVYELIDDDEDIPGTVGAVYLTEGILSDSDYEQDEALEHAFGQHFRAGYNDNPLPDNFPVVD